MVESTPAGIGSVSVRVLLIVVGAGMVLAGYNTIQAAGEGRDGPGACTTRFEKCTSVPRTRLWVDGGRSGPDSPWPWLVASPLLRGPVVRFDRRMISGPVPVLSGIHSSVRESRGIRHPAVIRSRLLITDAPKGRLSMAIGRWTLYPIRSAFPDHFGIRWLPSCGVPIKPPHITTALVSE